MLCFSSFQYHRTGASFSATGPRHRDSCGSGLADTNLVPSSTSAAPFPTSAAPLQDHASAASQSTRSSASPHPQTTPVTTGLQDIRQTYQQSGLTSESVDLLMSSWRPTTTKAYNTYIRKWLDYVNKDKIVSPTHIDFANFLVRHSTVIT